MWIVSKEIAYRRSHFCTIRALGVKASGLAVALAWTSYPRISGQFQRMCCGPNCSLHVTFAIVVDVHWVVFMKIIENTVFLKVARIRAYRKWYKSAKKWKGTIKTNDLWWPEIMELRISADCAGTVVFVCNVCVSVRPCVQIISFLGVFRMCYYCLILKWCCVLFLVSGCVNSGVK